MRPETPERGWREPTGSAQAPEGRQHRGKRRVE